MRAVNRITISGNVKDDPFVSTMNNDRDACTFVMISDRYTSQGIISVSVRVNIFIEGLVKLCQDRVKRGMYLIVEGELMNRKNKLGYEVTEIRALNLVLLPMVKHEDEVGPSVEFS